MTNQEPDTAAKMRAIGEAGDQALANIIDALKQLRDAWTIPGQHAGFHEYQKQHLHNRWPALEAAIIDVLNADPTSNAQRARRIHEAAQPIAFESDQAERADFERNRDEIVGYSPYSGGPEQPLATVIPARQSSDGWAHVVPAEGVLPPNPGIIAARQMGKPSLTGAEQTIKNISIDGRRMLGRN